MSVYILNEKCDSCMGLKEPMCVKVCPGDVLYVNGEKRIEPREQGDCWDCFACVKACPQQAICVRLPNQISNFSDVCLEATVWRDTTVWVCRDAEGREERFEIFSLRL